MLSQHPGNRQRQFPVEVHIQKHERKTFTVGNCQRAGKIEGEFQVGISQFLQDIFHRKRKHGVVFNDEDGKIGHSMAFNFCFIRPGMNI